MGLSKTEEREYARMLYVGEGLTQKEISQRCNVTEKTISNWADKYGWKKMKRSLMIVKDKQLSELYEKLEKLNENIKDKQDNLVSTKDVDSIVKLTSAIKQLEVDTSVGEIIDVAKKFIDFVRQDNLDTAKLVTEYFDVFIQSRVK